GCRGVAGQHRVDDAVEHHRHLADEDRPRLGEDAPRDRRLDASRGSVGAQRSPTLCPYPATALLLSPCQLLEQSPDDDSFVTGLEIDGIDRDLVEVLALVRALLDVDVRVTGA